MGLPYTPLKNTTINEHLKIYTDYKLPKGTYPTINYITIGVGGLSVINDSNDVLNVSTHTGDHAILFKQIPFRLVPVIADLDNEERLLYRLRKEIDINGETYVAYYLKVLDDDIKNGTIMHMSYNIDEDDKPELKPFNTESIDVLRPKPMSNNTSIGDTNNYLIKVSTVSSIFTKIELEGVKETLELLGYEEDSITEIGICSGYDIDIGGFTESISTQIMYHEAVDYNIQNIIELDEDILNVFDIGGVEPIISSF